MAWDLTVYGAAGGVTAMSLGTSLAAHRLFTWAGSPPVGALTGTGADADGITMMPFGAMNPAPPPDLVFSSPTVGYLAHPGVPVRVEAGAAFASGAVLQSDGTGRAITQTTGKGVLRALEAASAAGDIRWAVFTSGR